MGLIPAIAAPIPALRSQLQRVGVDAFFQNSSKTFAYRKAPPYRLRLPHQENTLIILQCFAQPLFERFAIGSFLFL
jgi:hypothetical protein